MGQAADPPRRGRPRSEEVRRTILAAALAELAERGYGGLTIEGIAARAGAGKQTVYRWWRSKADVVFEAMLDRAQSAAPAPDTGALEADLRAFLGATFAHSDQRPVLTGLMSEALRDASFMAVFRERFLLPRRAALAAVIDRAALRGELHTGADRELLCDIAFGVLWYRLMLGHAPLDERVARALAAAIAHAGAAASPSGAIDARVAPS
jgi:AcrR family transcriptional regulator